MKFYNFERSSWPLMVSQFLWAYNRASGLDSTANHVCAAVFPSNPELMNNKLGTGTLNITEDFALIPPPH